MKTTLKILALFCALVMVFSLAACGEKAEEASGSDASDAAQEDTRTDFGWAKFEMPAGYYDRQESTAYIAIEEEADNHHIIKLFRETLFSGKTAKDVAAEEAEGDGKSLGDSITVNGREWYIVKFSFNDKDSVELYTDVNESMAVSMTVYEMTETEAAVQTVLNTIEIIPEAE